MVFQTAPNNGWSVSQIEEPNSAVLNLDGRLEIFKSEMKQGDVRQRAYHAWQTSPNGGWSNILNGLINGKLDDDANDWDSGIGSGRNQDGHLEAFAVGTNGGCIISGNLLVVGQIGMETLEDLLLKVQ